MTRKSPNKRKSLAAATPGGETPKKQKLEAPTPKKGPDTPKNNPKTPKMETKTPKNTPKSMKKGATPFGKTPKSNKKGIKVENGVTEEGKSPQVAAKTPRSAKKQKNKQKTPKPVTPKVENDISEDSNEDVDMVSVQKTPKSAKKTPKPNKKAEQVQPQEDDSDEDESDTEKSSPKMKKFEGTNTLDVKSISEIDPEVMKNLSRNQRRKLVKKLKRKAKISEAQKTGQNDKTVAQKSIKEISETNSPKKTKRGNKKADSILQKTADLNTSGEKKSPGKNKKKNKNKGTPKKVTKSAKVPQKSGKVPESSSDESDYEVESEIQPEKITKSLNEGIVDDDEFIIGNKKKQKNKKDTSYPSSSGEEEDHEESTEPNKANDSEETASVQLSKPQKPGEKPNKKPKLSATIDLKDLNKGGIMKKGQTRYVLFVNNIPYTATKAQIQEHFAKVCPLKDVRIPIDKKSNKPKGFCYVELSTEADYQKALSVHHTFMNGRRINVLYTSPGQKNSDKKKKEIKKKNMKLQGMRKKGMLKGVPSDTQKRSARRAKKRFFDKQKAEKDGGNQV